MAYPAAQIIGALQNHVYGGRGDRQLKVSREIQDGLDFMRELLDFPELQESSQALDGVKPTEYRVKSFRVLRVALDGQHLGFNGGQMFAALEDEVGEKLGILRGQQIVNGRRLNRRLNILFESLLQTRNAFFKRVRDARVVIACRRMRLDCVQYI